MHPLLDLAVLLVRVVYFYVEAFVRKFLPQKTKDITGQNVLITGGGRGIGRAMAIRFSQQGTNVALWDMDPVGLKETEDELKIRGVNVHTYQCDVTDRASVKKAAEAVRKDMGDIDILCNNAGVLVGKRFMDLTENDIRKTFEVNTIAHFWTVKEFLPAMLTRKSGHIVTTASMAAKAGSPHLTDYCASKFAAYGFTESLRMELRHMDRHMKIFTTTVCPMFVNTALIHGDEVKQRISIRDRFGKMLQPDDVAVATVDGVLKNKTHVYVPPESGRVDFINGVAPAKARLAMYDFIGSYFEVADT